MHSVVMMSEIQNRICLCKCVNQSGDEICGDARAKSRIATSAANQLLTDFQLADNRKTDESSCIAAMGLVNIELPSHHIDRSLSPHSKHEFRFAKATLQLGTLFSANASHIELQVCRCRCCFISRRCHNSCHIRFRFRWIPVSRRSRPHESCQRLRRCHRQHSTHSPQQDQQRDRMRGAR